MRKNNVLLRQIHPSFFQNGKVTSQAFRPTPKDQSLLSVYDGHKMSPEQSFEHYVQILGLSSCAVAQIVCEDCIENELPVCADPEQFPEHCLIDFSDMNQSQQTKASKKLRQKAEERGLIYG